MNVLSYVLIALVASVPGLWIENYFATNPVWWTVVLAYWFGNLLGYFEGIKKNEKAKEKELCKE